MKILQIVKTSEGANWAFEQAKTLKERGIEIVTVLPDLKGRVAKKYIENNMKIIVLDCSLPINTPWIFFKRKRQIKDMIEKEAPDIIHLHFVTNVLMFRLILRNNTIPRLFQVPGPLHLESKIFKNIEILTATKQDYWAPSCNMSKQIYNESIKVNNSNVFLAYYGGYGGKTTELYQESQGILHKEYNISNNDIIIAMVSYFYKPKWYLGQTRGIKGHEDFIDAIEILNKKYNNITALVIGSAWSGAEKYQKQVIEYAKNKNIKNIIFIGFRSDLKKIYKEIDIVVHPSHSENLGGAAESLAAEVPTIATNVGGFPDIVINDKTGYLCEKENPQSIVENIYKILENKEKSIKLAKQGKQYVKKLLDIENTTKQIIKIYNEILERGKK